MAVKKFITGNFYDEAVLFPAVKKTRRAGYRIHDIFTPFPIHGLDKAMG
ncbi:MAG: quinol:electron acceptor oxidoreductase subunit ActD, partial [Chitinophagaceae bacterium]